MDQKPRARLRGCAIGCGVLLLVPVLGILAVSVRTCVPLHSASRTRARLDERFGPPGSFTPVADGSVPAERIRVFLEVRDTLSTSCEKFQAMLAKMDRVERLDEEPQSGEEVVETTRGFASVAAGIGPLIGEFFEQRNKALLEAKMGLGEYTYIFALSYRDRLRDGPGRELFFEGGLSPDVFAVLRAALSRQLAASAPGHGDERRLLEEEIRALQENPRRLPWSEGLPRAIEDSLRPYRDRLDRAYCQATAGIDMDPNSLRALMIALY